MDAALERNAFRVLSLPADAQAKEVYRQQQRIQNALELGDDDVVSGFPFIPKVPLSPEVVLEAVHRVDKQRAVEELFWVHQLGNKFDFRSGTVEKVLADLRADAVRNTTKGSVAQHNLAVILTCLAQGLNGSRRLDYWRDAIHHWNATLSNAVFWQFMQDRDELSNGSGKPPTPDELRSIACETMKRALLREVWNAVDERDYKAIAFLSAIIREYSLLLDADSTLTAIGNRMAKDGSVAIGGVLDRLSVVREDADTAFKRTALISAEKDLRKIGEDMESIIRAFGATGAFASLYDARAIALKQLSVAYFNFVDDGPLALRLVIEARSLARDPKLKSEVEAGWKHIRRLLVCSEAVALFQAKNYEAAQEKLAIALTLSTDEQKAAIEEMQEEVHRASVFRDTDTTKRTPSLYTVNGFGAKFYGKRDFDQKTKTYITTHWFVLLFVPIIPLACYRVCDTGPNLYSIYGCVPVSPVLRTYRWAILVLIALLLLVAMVTNSDTSGSSSSSTGRSAPPTYSSAPANSDASSGDSSDRLTSEQAGTTAGSTESSAVDKDAIEAGRAELRTLSDSLDTQKQQIEEESAALRQMESYIHSVKDTYTEDTVPESVREQYNSTVDEYDAKVPAYNAAVRAYKADLQQYEERRAAFNQRVDRYNANR